MINIKAKKEEYTYNIKSGAWIYNKDKSQYWITKRVGGYWGYCNNEGYEVKVDWV
jgi:hypothetical protein